MFYNIDLRQATVADLPEIQIVFVETIRQVANSDYNPAQIEAWAAGVRNQKRWEDAIDDQYFLVATAEDAIVGFGSLDEGGYLDFLYVHKDYQRKGIAHTLYEQLEQEAISKNCVQITTNASKTARLFFLAQGFEVVKENSNQIRGVEVVNYRMQKVL
ncbi:MAG: GNAT family N-acetyltransferase [Cyclobacteriaceae bacterium]